jgi:hypothetical protein
MSLVSTVANYGGRQPDNIQNIKQFVVGVGSQVVWVFRRLASGITVQTPADRFKPVLINSDLYVNGSIFNPSDKNLKTNIEPITDDKSNSIINLEPIEFNYKDDKAQRKHLGFIAQDVEKLYPELVIGGQNDVKSINYVEFIPLLVLKIQNQQKEIDELREQINELREQINELRVN